MLIIPGACYVADDPNDEFRLLRADNAPSISAKLPLRKIRRLAELSGESPNEGGGGRGAKVGRRLESCPSSTSSGEAEIIYQLPG